MTEGERVKLVRKEKGLTLEKFGKQFGMGASSISDIENGRRALTRQNRISICREFNVSEVWLCSGEGEMFVPLDEDAEFTQICEEINISDDNLIKQIIRTYWHMNEVEKAAVRKLIDGISQK